MKAALITGASSGIGEAFARRLAAERHDLVLVARSEAKLAALCDELMAKHKVTANYVAVDLNDFNADKRLFEETENQGLKIDYLINNAGFGSMGYFSELELETELEMISLNIMALVALTHRYLGPMRKRKSGTIINVSSSAGYQPIPFMATYAATKAFVTSFSEAIAEENREFGIRVMALCPGATETNFFEASGIKDPVQVKGIQTAEEVVDTALDALKRGKSSVVPGWVNYLVSKAAGVAPDRLTARTIGSVLRKRLASERLEADKSDG
ncbi:MAG: SDR family oxidoreductase [Pyrinomonadaceae bacterium]